jgi:Holliday junction resolvase
MAEPVNGRGQYQRGVRFEHTTLYDLRKNGYYAQRTPGSRGAADVIAVKRGQVLLVQCKISGGLAPAPWNDLYDAALHCGAVPVMAEKDAHASLRYWRLERRKDGHGGRQPMALFLLDELEPR